MNVSNYLKHTDSTADLHYRDLNLSTMNNTAMSMERLIVSIDRLRMYGVSYCVYQHAWACVY